MSLIWARSIQSISHLTHWRSVLILSSHIRIGLPSDLFLSGLPIKTLCESLLSPPPFNTYHMPRPTQSIGLITLMIFGEDYISLSSSLCSLLHSPVTSSLFGPKYLPQHAILKHSQHLFLPQCEISSSSAIKITETLDRLVGQPLRLKFDTGVPRRSVKVTVNGGHGKDENSKSVLILECTSVKRVLCINTKESNALY